MRPAGQLVAIGKLQLPQHGRHMGLDRLDGYEQLAGNLFVGVTPGDQAQHFALPRAQLVELGVQVDSRRHRSAAEGVEHKPGQTRRENCVSGRHGGQRLDQLGGRDRFGHVAAGTGADGLEDVVWRVRDRKARKRTAGRDEPTCLIISGPPPPGMCTSTSTTSGEMRQICSTRQRHRPPRRLTSTCRRPGQLVADAGTEKLVVVDDEDARAGTVGHLGAARRVIEAALLAIVRDTSVPCRGSCGPWRYRHCGRTRP